ncbi:MAG: hypothetical protein IT580_09190, partial [Verrucomicrobiales bacterium]|nr:hypothetical protein [Verrucomicrobiales bacterium]
MTRRRALQWASLGAILSLLTPVIVAWHADRQLPQFEGRSARAWFHRFHREHALDFEGRADEATRLECKTAFLEMPPEVLPFLVREALTPRRDSALRTNLHAIWKDMPPWAGRGMFAPESAAPD